MGESIIESGWIALIRVHLCLHPQGDITLLYGFSLLSNFILINQGISSNIEG